MHCTAGHRQKWQTMHNTQQVVKNQPIEEQTKTPTLTLPNLEIHTLKNN